MSRPRMIFRRPLPTFRLSAQWPRAKSSGPEMLEPQMVEGYSAAQYHRPRRQIRPQPLQRSQRTSASRQTSSGPQPQTVSSKYHNLSAHARQARICFHLPKPDPVTTCSAMFTAQDSGLGSRPQNRQLRRFYVPRCQDGRAHPRTAGARFQDIGRRNSNRHRPRS